MRWPSRGGKRGEVERRRDRLSDRRSGDRQRLSVHTRAGDSSGPCPADREVWPSGTPAARALFMSMYVAPAPVSRMNSSARPFAQTLTKTWFDHTSIGMIAGSVVVEVAAVQAAGVCAAAGSAATIAARTSRIIRIAHWTADAAQWVSSASSRHRHFAPFGLHDDVRQRKATGGIREHATAALEIRVAARGHDRAGPPGTMRAPSFLNGRLHAGVRPLHFGQFAPV